MKPRLKYFFLGCFAIFITLLLIYLRPTLNYLKLAPAEEIMAESKITNLPVIEAKAKQLLHYARENNMDTSVSFLIDMSLPSGKNRFYIYDFSSQKITDRALVTHGSCYESVLKGKRYSNTIGGGCTSLGKYKIGKSYMGKFGLAYKLYGLEESNSNAFERFVVLHSHSCVPDAEVAPYPICLSEGCPTVSLQFLKVLSKIIDSKTRPILMEIFDERI
jgi:hypothetical protein